MKPRLLDLFCGAGGATRGYQAAGFHVTGVDIAPQPRYCGDEFHQADALDFPLDGFDAIHASPPCQAFSIATAYHPGAKAEHPDLVDPIRQRLALTGLPFIIENVAGAPLRRDVLLCGEMFGLRLHRHRYFETHGFLCLQPPHTRHRLRGAIHNCHIEDGYARQVAGNFADLADASDAMGVDWMNRAELAEAIPPAYTAFIGRQLLSAVAEGVA